MFTCGTGYVLECLAEVGDFGLQIDLLGTVDLTLLRNINKIAKSNLCCKYVHGVAYFAWKL